MEFNSGFKGLKRSVPIVPRRFVYEAGWQREREQDYLKRP